MRAFLSAFRLQAREIRVSPDHVMPLATAPLLTITFIAIVREAGRADLTAYALMAPVLMSLWSLSLFISGEIVAGDRRSGTLEPTIATPSSFAAILLGRIAAVTTVALVSFGEAWLAGWAAFGTAEPIRHPFAFALTLAVTCVATSGTAVVMAGLFVFSRSTRTFQNSLSYPVYVLGGVLVPVSLLPGWLQPLSKAVFLSWSADLLRSSLAAGTVHDLAGRVAVVLGLGAAGYAIGGALVAWVLTRARRDGSLGLV